MVYPKSNEKPQNFRQEDDIRFFSKRDRYGYSVPTGDETRKRGEMKVACTGEEAVGTERRRTLGRCLGDELAGFVEALRGEGRQREEASHKTFRSALEPSSGLPCHVCSLSAPG